MNNENDRLAEEIAFELGQRAVQDATEQIVELCTCETRIIEATTAPEQVELQALAAVVEEEEKRLRSELQTLPLSDNVPRLEVCYRWAAISFMFAAGYAFAYATFAPFGLGMTTQLISLGATAVPMICIHEFLRRCRSRWFPNALAAIALVAGSAALLAVAAVRGEVFAFYLKTTLMTSTGAGSLTDDAIAFYKNSEHLLQLICGLLALAMDVVGGLVLHEALKPVPFQGQRERVCGRLADIGTTKVELARRFVENENRAKIREAAVLREFYRGVLRAARKGSRSIKVLGIVAALLLPCFGQPQVVQGLDSSRSMLSMGYDGKSTYEKCLDGIANTIPSMPAGTQLTVLGITAESFSKPWVLLSVQLPREKGQMQFLDQVELAKDRMRTQIRHLSERVHPNARHSDILGFFVYAADLLREKPQAEKVILVFSDMRQSTPGIDFEKRAVIEVPQTLRSIERQQLLPDLHGIDVYVSGVHAAGKSVSYWRSLRAFWAEYFRRSGASLKAFSMTNEPRIWPKQ